MKMCFHTVPVNTFICGIKPETVLYLYECQTWSLNLREEYRLMVGIIKNLALRKILATQLKKT